MDLVLTTLDQLERRYLTTKTKHLFHSGDFNIRQRTWHYTLFYEQIPNNKIPSFRHPLICYDKCTKLVTYWVQRIEETGEADE